jgi:hypothetical protein
LFLLLGAAFFLLLPPLPGKREGTIIGLSAWYFAWSLWYQQKRGRLDIRIVLEYLVIAFLGAVVLFSLT